MKGKSTTINERFGPIPKDIGLTKVMRSHQGWWRTNVLCEDPGLHPLKTGQRVCNTILNGRISNSNFLNSDIVNAVKDVLNNRTKENSGIIEEERLYNNLLSSQPLCFNFFGNFYQDKNFGLLVLKSFYPDLTKLNEVFFEFAPKEKYLNDGSAFDIAFDVQMGNRRGLIGLECKYTDTFSYKPSKSTINYGDIDSKNHDTYLAIFNKSKSQFLADYYEYVRNKDFNQLFRNQLIAVSLVQNKNYDFVKTGLFCYQDDQSATKIAGDFRSKLKENDSFKLITYSDFIRNVQRLELSWELREWSMLLWARYCGTVLSEKTVKQL